METDPPLPSRAPTSSNPAERTQGLTAAEYLAAEDRLTAAEKAALASHLAAGLGSPAHEGIVEAEAVLRLIAWNAEPPVLEAMAEAAAGNPNTPRSIAWALANDHEAAAMVVLEVCAALSDDDLISIVQAGASSSKTCAIARRPEVSENVSSCLVEQGGEDAVHALLANVKAAIPSDAFSKMLDRFSDSERIHEGILDRPSVPGFLVQRLSTLVSAKLRTKLAARSASDVLPGYADERSAAEWDMHLAAMVRDRSLDETRLVRELCSGNLEFFVRALSALSGTAYAEVRAAVLDTPPALALSWEKAALPKGWMPIATAAVTALVQTDRSAGHADRDLFCRNIAAGTLANLRAANFTLTDAQRRLFHTARGR